MYRRVKFVCAHGDCVYFVITAEIVYYLYNPLIWKLCINSIHHGKTWPCIYKQKILRRASLARNIGIGEQAGARIDNKSRSLPRFSEPILFCFSKARQCTKWIYYCGFWTILQEEFLYLFAFWYNESVIMSTEVAGLWIWIKNIILHVHLYESYFMRKKTHQSRIGTGKKTIFILEIV